MVYHRTIRESNVEGHTHFDF